eukprot:NODE_203_length_14950_cov_0.414450.p6 type:complete len:334 gc:universal NODE_203_length_14950_cov_0.414450:9781-8780(-)
MPLLFEFLLFAVPRITKLEATFGQTMTPFFAPLNYGGPRLIRQNGKHIASLSKKPNPSTILNACSNLGISDFEPRHGSNEALQAGNIKQDDGSVCNSGYDRNSKFNKIITLAASSTPTQEQINSFQEVKLVVLNLDRNVPGLESLFDLYRKITDTNMFIGNLVVLFRSLKDKDWPLFIRDIIPLTPQTVNSDPVTLELLVGLAQLCPEECFGNLRIYYTAYCNKDMFGKAAAFKFVDAAEYIDTTDPEFNNWEADQAKWIVLIMLDHYVRKMRNREPNGQDILDKDVQNINNIIGLYDIHKRLIRETVVVESGWLTFDQDVKELESLTKMNNK